MHKSNWFLKEKFTIERTVCQEETAQVSFEVFLPGSDWLNRRAFNFLDLLRS